MPADPTAMPTGHPPSTSRGARLRACSEAIAIRAEAALDELRSELAQHRPDPVRLRELLRRVRTECDRYDAALEGLLHVWVSGGEPRGPEPAAARPPLNEPLVLTGGPGSLY